MLRSNNEETKFENGAEAKQLPVSERRLGQRVNI